ncbi:MAG: helix-turn-helix domain-containing protein [Myxococcota bacterium]
METPGAMLKRARLERGIGLDELAQTTRISSATLLHLERDSYDELPAEVFVRGFLRNVARELEIGTEAVIQAYEHHTGRIHKPAMRLVDAAAKAEQQRSSQPSSLPQISFIKRLTAQSTGGGSSRSRVFDQIVDTVGSARPSYVIATLVVLLGIALGISVLTSPRTNLKGPSKATWNIKADGPKARWILDGQSKANGTAAEMAVPAPDQAD